MKARNPHPAQVHREQVAATETNTTPREIFGMKLTRREFTGLAIGAAAGAMSRPLFGQTGRWGSFFEWAPIGDGALVAIGVGGNALLVKSGQEAVLIDCKNFGYGNTLRREATKTHGAELTTVINTHHHGDHIGGNQAFTNDILLISQRNAKERITAWAMGTIKRVQPGGEAMHERMMNQMREQAASEGGAKTATVDMAAFFDALPTMEASAFTPTETFEDHHEIKVGELTVILHHAGAGHTDNDAFIFIPELNVLHTGDLCFHKLHPFIDMTAGATSAGWIRSCDAMLELCDTETTVVPGHGEIGGKAAITGQREYFKILRDAMVKAHADGVSRADAIAMEIPAFDGYGFERIKERTFASVFDEMQGK